MLNPELNILKEEREIKPNRYAANAMTIAIVVLLIDWILNEINIFHVDPLQMRVGTVVAIIIALIPRVLVQIRKLREHPATKYIIMGCALTLTFLLLVLVFFHITLLLVFPILLAMQYRSYRVGWMALIGSLICTFLTPVVSYLIGAWDTPFLYTLVQMATEGSAPMPEVIAWMPPLDNLPKIILYVAIPRMLSISGFGVMMFYVIRNGVENVQNQVKIHRLGDRDMLTGLYNRNFYQVVIDTRHGEGTVGVMFFDVNGLKKSNDVHGHEYGDTLLRRCAESIRRIQDDQTTGYRIGGDEFLVMVEAETREAFDEKVEEWKEALRKINEENQRRYSIGLQCDMALGTAFGSFRELQMLIHEADAMMYECKKKRKDQINQ